VSGQLHAPAAYPQGKSPWYPLDRRLGGPQSRSGRGGEEKNSQPLPGAQLKHRDDLTFTCTFTFTFTNYDLITLTPVVWKLWHC